MSNLAYWLVACLCCGEFAGLLHECFELGYRAFQKKGGIQITLDILFGLLFGTLFVAFSVLFCFPNVRLFLLLAAVAGFYLYRGSLHRLLAFFTKRIYNRYRSGRKARLARLSVRNEGREI